LRNQRGSSTISQQATQFISMAAQHVARQLLCTALRRTAASGGVLATSSSAAGASLACAWSKATIPASARPAGALAAWRALATSATSGRRSIVDAIKDEHARVMHMYTEYQKDTTTEDRKQMLAWQIIRDLSTHASKEEMVLYPALRDVFGDEAPDHALDEHQKLKELLYHLDSLDISHSDFNPTLQAAIDELQHHVKGEEEQLLPKFASAPGMTQERLMELGERFINAESIAPTRPHPAAPNKPPLNKVANATAVPLDKAKDSVRFGMNPTPQ
jgi:hemerythrin-like domain-containing protein